MRILWARAIHPAEAVDLLDAHERMRLAALLKPADRARFAAAHVLARLALADATGIRPGDLEFDVTCPRCGGPHGKPRLVGASTQLHFNLAHSGDRVVVAISTTAPVGVDVEAIDAAIDRVDDVALSASERTALASLPAEQRTRARAIAWTRKEAALKCVGAGLLTEPSDVTVTSATLPAAVLSWPLDTPVELVDLDLGDGYAASAAIAAPLRERVVTSCADQRLAAWAAEHRRART